MDSPHYFEIRVEGDLSDGWSDWFDGLEIYNSPDGKTILSGMISDQPALFGVLSKIQALNLTLVSINSAANDEA